MLDVATIVTSVPLALHVGLPERDEVLPGRHDADIAPVELVLEEDDGIVVPDRGLEQPLRVERRRRKRHLEAGDMTDPRVQRLAVLRSRAPCGSERRSEDERHLPAPPDM